MVNVRCSNFDDTTWVYVTKYAELKGITRCEALEQIVKEHMKVVADAQTKLYRMTRKNVK
jgi:hypothetical protein